MVDNKTGSQPGKKKVGVNCFWSTKYEHQKKGGGEVFLVHKV